MRILVFPHAMELGGSQLNAIELAAAVRDLGHEVVVVSEAGMLADRVAALGLSHVLLAPRVGIRPSWRVVKQLRAIQRAQRFDLVHGYEWPPALEVVLGPGRDGVGVIGTVMSMSVAPFLPLSMPLIVGTQNIANDAVRTGLRDVHVMNHRSISGATPPGPSSLYPGAHSMPARTHSCWLSYTDWFQNSNLRGCCRQPRRWEASTLAARTRTCSLSATARSAQRFNNRPTQPGLPLAIQSSTLPVYYRILALLMRPAISSWEWVGRLCVGGRSRSHSLCRANRVSGRHSRRRRLDNLWNTAGTGSEILGCGPTQGAARLTARVADLFGPLRCAMSLGEWGRYIVELNYSLDTAAVSLVNLYQEVADRGNMIPARESRTAAIDAMKHTQFRRLRTAYSSVPSDDFNAVSAVESGAAEGKQDA